MVGSKDSAKMWKLENESHKIKDTEIQNFCLWKIVVHSQDNSVRLTHYQGENRRGPAGLDAFIRYSIELCLGKYRSSRYTSGYRSPLWNRGNIIVSSLKRSRFYGGSYWLGTPLALAKKPVKLFESSFSRTDAQPARPEFPRICLATDDIR